MSVGITIERREALPPVYAEALSQVDQAKKAASDQRLFVSVYDSLPYEGFQGLGFQPRLETPKEQLVPSDLNNAILILQRISDLLLEHMTKSRAISRESFFKSRETMLELAKQAREKMIQAAIKSYMNKLITGTLNAVGGVVQAKMAAQAMNKIDMSTQNIPSNQQRAHQKTSQGLAEAGDNAKKAGKSDPHSLRPEINELKTAKSGLENVAYAMTLDARTRAIQQLILAVGQAMPLEFLSAIDSADARMLEHMLRLIETDQSNTRDYMGQVVGTKDNAVSMLRSIQDSLYGSNSRVAGGIA